MDIISWKNRIIEIRTGIRGHRDALRDHRCWLDDYLVWSFLPNAPQVPNGKSPAEMMIRCTQFYTLRRANILDRPPANAIFDPTLWDSDLHKCDPYQLTRKHFVLIHALEEHRRTTLVRPLKTKDDRKLYLVLPEKIPADFRLPPRGEFLGRDKQGAGCPNFFDSHANCDKKVCNLHQWGPCPNAQAS